MSPHRKSSVVMFAKQSIVPTKGFDSCFSFSFSFNSKGFPADFAKWNKMYSRAFVPNNNVIITVLTGTPPVVLVTAAIDDCKNEVVVDSAVFKCPVTSDLVRLAKSKVIHLHFTIAAG